MSTAAVSPSSSSSSQLPDLLTLVGPLHDSCRYFVQLERLKDADILTVNGPPSSSPPDHDFHFRLCRHHCLKQFYTGGNPRVRLIRSDPTIAKWVNYGDLIDPDTITRNPNSSSSLSNLFDEIPSLASLAPWLALFATNCNNDRLDKSACRVGMRMHVIIVKLEYYYINEDDNAMAREARESARTMMVPGSKSAIEGLKKVDSDPDENA